MARVIYVAGKLVGNPILAFMLEDWTLAERI